MPCLRRAPLCLLLAAGALARSELGYEGSCFCVSSHVVLQACTDEMLALIISASQALSSRGNLYDCVQLCLVRGSLYGVHHALCDDRVPSQHSGQALLQLLWAHSAPKRLSAAFCSGLQSMRRRNASGFRCTSLVALGFAARHTQGHLAAPTNCFVWRPTALEGRRALSDQATVAGLACSLGSKGNDPQRGGVSMTPRWAGHRLCTGSP